MTVNERHETWLEVHEAEIVAAWREQLAEAAENPWLAQLLLRYGERILRRFIAFYREVQALPQRTRRYIERKLALGPRRSCWR